ncbi:MAG: type I-B CRISPR-associated protein Cas5b [Clostridia bacterium]
MKILKIKLFQEAVCYKKPFAFKVSETYPLPPYSTVIGMMHKILDAKSGEYFPMDISIQGDYENIFNNYQTLRTYKKNEVTTMPRNVNMLYNVNLMLHIKAEDYVIDKIYNNILSGSTALILGRNEDFARLDEIKYVENTSYKKEKELKYNAYIKTDDGFYDEDISGINYRLNTIYKIDKNNLRKWEKVDVKYIEKGTSIGPKVLCDDDGDIIVFKGNGE